MSASPARLRFFDMAPVVALGALGLFLGALAFEHWGGLSPCHLCLLQRGPLVAAALLGATAWVSGPFEPAAGRLALAGAGLCLALGAGLGVYHSGVELGWWPGPDSCSGSFQFPASGADLAKMLERARLVRCDRIPWSLAGLSLANYNAILSGALATLAGYAVIRKPQ